jgi:hypothetical protein
LTRAEARYWAIQLWFVQHEPATSVALIDSQWRAANVLEDGHDALDPALQCWAEQA